MCRIQFPIIWYATQCDGVHTKVKFKVTKRSNTTFLPSESNGRILLKFGGMIGHDLRNNRLVLGVIGSKVKVKVTKRSKTKFCDISANLYPISMKPAPKCAEFNSP